MRTNCSVATAVLAGLISSAQCGVAQGPLSPPGAPGPVMRTLDQVEPRSIITSLPFTISQPGSYYLVTNLTGAAGITVSSGNVCIDLNGFSLTQAGTTAGIVGIDGMAANNVTILNGRILSWQGGGIRLSSVAHVQDVNVENCAGPGINVGQQSHVLRCRVGNCSSGDGIALGVFSIVEDCRSVMNGTNGIAASLGCQVWRCISTHNVIDGIRISDRCIVSDNIANYNGNGGDGAGIHVTGTRNRVENNHVLASDRGLDIDGTDNYVDANTIEGNTDNYDIVAGNQLNLLICQLPETLEWPCTARLAGTLLCSQTSVNGITVNANDVTIEMGGHALVGPGSSSGDGIAQAAGYRNLRVRDGNVVNWHGVNRAGVRALGLNTQISGMEAESNTYGFVTGNGAHVSECSATANGVGMALGEGSSAVDCMAYTNQTDGISGDKGSSLSRCVAQGNGNDGISGGMGSAIADCVATVNGRTGIYAGEGSSVAKCTARSNKGDGFYADIRVVVTDCSAWGNGDDGFFAGEGTSLRGCNSARNTGDGIEVGSDAVVERNTCDGNGSGGDGAGIHATGSDNRIAGNQATDNDRGLDLDGSGSAVADNIVKGNADNYDFAALNQLNLLISQTPETLDWPCSARLAGTLMCASTGLVVNSDNVTIDLAGFGLLSTNTSYTGDAILLNGSRCNIAIQNGFIQGAITNVQVSVEGGGFRNGIVRSAGGSLRNVRVAHVSVSGCLEAGIYLGFEGATIVEFCTAALVGTYGIWAGTVNNSSAVDCATVGIAAECAQNCNGSSVGWAGDNGIWATVALNCRGKAQGETGSGIYARHAMNCSGYATGIDGYGIQCQVAVGCEGSSDSGHGLKAEIANSCDGNNHQVNHSYDMP